MHYASVLCTTRKSYTMVCYLRWYPEMAAPYNRIISTWRTVFTEWRKKTIEKRVGGKRLSRIKCAKKNRRRT